MRFDRARRAAAVLLGAGLLLGAAPARAFPGSARWGYANCATCHFNVSGGGILTPYGRELSRELLSTSGGEREARFAYDAIPTPAWLALGGDLSGLLTSRRAAGSHGHFDLLQADLEVAAQRGKLLAVATLGLRTDDPDESARGPGSRRHYLQLNLTPALSLRGGRFLPNYGIWNGDLGAATRAGLGWRENSESYNLEANLVLERFSLAATGILGRLDEPAPQRESGLSLSASGFFGGKRRVGVSVLDTASSTHSRRALGVHAVLGIGEHAYLLMETDLQRLRHRPGALPARSYGLLSNWCFARETVKGLYVLLLNELARPQGASGRLSYSYGAALRWFARPHLEFQLRWRRQDAEALSPPELDGVSVYAHFYP